MELTVTSAAFAEGGTIPAAYCADGIAGALNTSPPLAWSEPPASSGDHAYVVTVYALDIDQPEIPAEPSSADIGRAVDGHVLAQGSLTGVFGR